MDSCKFCKANSIELKRDGYYCSKCRKKQEQPRKQYTSPFGEDYRGKNKTSGM